jgi:hypothetical protein
MAYEVSDHYSKQFTANTELLLQRTGPKLLPFVTMASYEGESAQIVKQFGSVEFNSAAGRFEDTVWSEIEHKQRWIFPTDYDLALPIDKRDEIRMVGELQSPYVAAMAKAYGRKVDDIIVDAMFAASRTGVNGGTSTTHPSGQQVAAAATGLTIAKLRSALKILRENEIDLDVEKPLIAVTAKQLDNLLGTTEVTSADYNSVKALVNGDIDTFLGFKFIHTQALDADGSSNRRVPVWVPSGVHFGTWNGLETDIGPRRDKKNTMQIFMRFTAAATRVEEKKVVEIQCVES